MAAFQGTKKDYPDKLFIFISQVDKSGNLADKHGGAHKV